MNTEDNMNSTDCCRNETVTSIEEYPSWLSTLFLLFAVVGFLSNILVSITILKCQFLHDVTHYLILNLAVSDSLCCFMFGLEMFLDLLQYPNNDTSGIAEKLYCRLIHGNYLFQSFAYISAYNLVIISLERYVGIVHPLHYVQICSKVNITGALVLAWLLGFCAYTVHLFGVVYDPSKATYLSRCWLEHDWRWHFVPFVGGFIIPLITMIWAYTRIIQTLKQSALAQDVSLQVTEMREATRRTVYLMLTVTIAYMILYIPTQPAYMVIVNVKLGIFELSPLGMLLTDLASKLPVFLNSFINPFIYAFKYKKFRNGLRGVLCTPRRNGAVLQDQSHLRGGGSLPTLSQSLETLSTCQPAGS
ncbi:prolactin-releasing peptide receptor-like [Acanthaster planci]|uniref:Prolactin-releasing peptide receptor-like n=1 Tax=Acanthaster planci TaxID=133434 RepID=A0A8B7ZLF6_ACAPL|nr:prolactin-releasing peptide receptor-like [Acanthaster planci]